MVKLIDILNEIIEEKADRCLRIARRKYDKPSAYRSGAIVKCRQGKIWKGLKEEDIVEDIKENPEGDYSEDEIEDRIQSLVDDYSNDFPSYLREWLSMDLQLLNSSLTGRFLSSGRSF
jgi:hypothetical protein